MQGSTIKTGGATNLKRLAGLGYQHQRFVGVDSKEPAHVNMPGVRMIGSLLKRWLTGTLHDAESQEHLAYYLDDYTFRFNHRRSNSRRLLFYRLLQQAVALTHTPRGAAESRCARRGPVLTLLKRVFRTYVRVLC